MTILSVNVNKIATLRNSRGKNTPNLDFCTQSIINYGAEGITIHPRPDQRHINYNDVKTLSHITKKVEFNIEGFPSKKFLDIVLDIKPTQVTLVPDGPGVLTSLEGWDIIKNKVFLTDIVKQLNNTQIRTSIFIHPNIDTVQAALDIGADRIELFTGFYADNNKLDSYIECSQYAHTIGLGVNAGHDLSLKNLPLFIEKMPFLDEVSIGHALISESLFFGLQKTIRSYKDILK